MGGEMGHPWEWDFHVALPWYLLDHAEHRGVHRLVGDLNRLYTSHPALHARDFDSEGFQWIDCNDTAHSTVAYLRRGADRTAVVVLNFTPQPRTAHRIGVPEPGWYEVKFNSDSAHYGGVNMGVPGVQASHEPLHGQPCSIAIDLPPLAGLVLERVG
jgi:1,4-alpha-glucan branching enzyme